MSQTTSAVRLGSHCMTLSTVHHCPLPLDDSTQERVRNSRSSAWAVEKQVNTRVQLKSQFAIVGSFIVMLYTMRGKRARGKRMKSEIKSECRMPNAEIRNSKLQYLPIYGTG